MSTMEAMAPDAINGNGGASPVAAPTTTLVAEARSVTEASLTMVTDAGVPVQVRELMDQINRSPRLSIDPKAQQELARMVKVLPDLVAKDDPYLTHAARLAVSSLLEGQPSVAFARAVRHDIENQVSRWKGPVRAMYRGRPPMRATLGLVLFLVVGGVAMLLVAALAADRRSLHIDGVDGGLLAVAAAMGGVGSIISIFVRVPHMSRDFASADPEVPFFVGLFKPMVGIAFAVFLYAAIQGRFVPIEVDDTRSGAFFMALSFIAGFSERFVPDIINKAERQEPAAGGEGRDVTVAPDPAVLQG